MSSVQKTHITCASTLSRRVTLSAQSRPGRYLDAALSGDAKALECLALSVPVEPLYWQTAKDHDVDVFLRRDDTIHAQLGGNKLYKLSGHLQCYLKACKDQQAHSDIVSFGGAYSNHLYALAAAGNYLNTPTVGIIRGEKPKRPSATLHDLQAMGMRLIFVSRQDYRYKNDAAWRNSLAYRYQLTAPYWIAEGGDGELGLLGCRILGRVLANNTQDMHIDEIFHACGTGTTLLGIAQGLQTSGLPTPRLTGIAALKSDQSIVTKLRSGMTKPFGAGVTPQRATSLAWAVTNQHALGGFARGSQALSEFMAMFTEQTGVLLDRVYTAKIFFALSTLIQAGVYAPGTRLLVVHSGGLQGNRPHPLSGDSYAVS